MSVKINQLELKNVKRIRAVKLSPSENGLTIIGGRNNQGKTSVLDAIAWALGGDRYRPSQAQRDDSVLPPHLHVTLSNGLVVERKGKNADLKVLDPNGKKAGQQMLSDFIAQLALDLPKFMQASSREKADFLLQVIGVGDKLEILNQQETQLYNQRLAIGRIADQKEKFAREMTEYPEAPADLVSPSELIAKQQDILAQNGANQRLRAQKEQLAQECARLEIQFSELSARLDAVRKDLALAASSAQDLQDASTLELEENIRNIEEINRKVRANLDREKAREDAAQHHTQYKALDEQIEGVRSKRRELLESAHLPLPELSVEDGELTYHGKRWDGMSGSEQLKVATAIVRRMNPNCGFVLLDKLEQMDLDTLREFGQWLELEGLQVIATRVSTGDECSVIIEDGYVQGEAPEVPERKGWF